MVTNERRLVEVLRQAALGLEELYRVYEHDPAPEATDLIAELRTFADEIAAGHGH